MIDSLFRGWSKKHKDWVFGYYVKSRHHHYILQQYNSDGYDERWETSDWIEVEEDSVSWKTGLKDRIGKDVYGNDFIKRRFPGMDVILGLIDSNGSVGDYNIDTKKWIIIHVGSGQNTNALWYGLKKN